LPVTAPPHWQAFPAPESGKCRDTGRPGQHTGTDDPRPGVRVRARLSLTVTGHLRGCQWVGTGMGCSCGYIAGWARAEKGVSDGHGAP
jgi:hypothetical protein